MRCPCAFQDERRGFGSSKSLVLLPPRRALFLSYVTSFSCGRRGIWGILKSGTSFSVTGAGHRALFHRCGRSGTFWTLPKCWQARVKMTGAFGRHFAWEARYLLMSLAQPSRHFVRVGSPSLWRGANFDIARATSRHSVHVGSLSLWRSANFDMTHATLSALFACRIALFFPEAPAKGFSQRTAAKFNFSLHLHNISYILCITYIIYINFI